MASRYFWRPTSLSKLLDNPVNLVMKVGRKDYFMLPPMNTINWAVHYYCNLESSMQFPCIIAYCVIAVLLDTNRFLLKFSTQWLCN